MRRKFLKTVVLGALCFGLTALDVQAAPPVDWIVIQTWTPNPSTITVDANGDYLVTIVCVYNTVGPRQCSCRVSDLNTGFNESATSGGQTFVTVNGPGTVTFLYTIPAASIWGQLITSGDITVVWVEAKLIRWVYPDAWVTDSDANWIEVP